MASQPLNLVERAAEQLRRSGLLDPSAAQLLERDKPLAQDKPLARDKPLEPDRETGNDSHQPVLVPAPERPQRAKPTIDRAVLERAGMIEWSKGRSRASEEFRIIQAQVMRAAFAAEPGGAGRGNLVMVTSARPGEGKSFAALNLAMSIARQRDHAVLLVDTDSKEQSVGRCLGLVDAPGLLDLATNPELSIDELIVPTAFEKLAILPLGSQPERSDELFATRQMARVIRDLGRRYADRVVILDAAPCLSSSDPSTLAPIVGQVVLVVEAGRTQRPEVEAALDLIQSCPAISLLLNKVQISSRHTFGAYASSYSSS